jgi:hypothetical protein
MRVYTITTVNCHHMKMTEQNHNFKPKRMIFLIVCVDLNISINAPIILMENAGVMSSRKTREEG